jgi:hypothetical protein
MILAFIPKNASKRIMYREPAIELITDEIPTQAHYNEITSGCQMN